MSIYAYIAATKRLLQSSTEHNYSGVKNNSQCLAGSIDAPSQTSQEISLIESLGVAPVICHFNGIIYAI